MNKMILLKADEQECLELEVKENEVSYMEMKDAVGGLIERVPFFKTLEKNNIDLWCNEEGKCMGLPINLFVFKGKKSKQRMEDIRLAELLVGDLLFTSRDMMSGITLPLNEQQIEVVKKFCDNRVKFLGID